MSSFSPDEIHRLVLTGIASGGEAVGRLSELVVFVPGGAPGDEADIKLVEVKKNYARGEIMRIIKSSTDRCEPECSEYCDCGGCQLQHMAYSSQLNYKKKIVEDVISRIGNLKDVRIADPLPSPSPWRYRNKMQVAAASGTEGNIYFGLFEKKSHKAVRMEECLIQSEESNKILKAAEEIINTLKWTAYNEKTGTGLLRYLVTRVSSKGDVMLILVVTKSDIPDIDKFQKELIKKAPYISSIFINVNNKKTNVIIGEKFTHIYGEKRLIEEINGIKYAISPGSFFQVNTPQTGRLFGILDEAINLNKEDIVIDAYCGVGAISLRIAGRVKKVVGIEEVVQAEEDAIESARLNGIDNFKFKLGAVEKILPKLVKDGIKPDAVIFDPPRKGVDKEILFLIAKLGISRIGYVSCNPATLARDISILSGYGYKTPIVYPVDMFPHTCHIECVAGLFLDDESKEYIDFKAQNLLNIKSPKKAQTKKFNKRRAAKPVKKTSIKKEIKPVDSSNSDSQPSSEKKEKFYEAVLKKKEIEKKKKEQKHFEFSARAMEKKAKKKMRNKAG